MSLNTRREFLSGIRNRYQNAPWLIKGQLIDEIVLNCGYDRKYAIRLMNTTGKVDQKTVRTRSSRYNSEVRQALRAVWYAANQICSKRLVPFLPELVENMEQHGHLKITADDKEILLSIGHSTMDRLLTPERRRIGKSRSTTTAGSLLKHQIQVRTFADWDDVTPGFFEADLVAHCGSDTHGKFINTLVLVDVSTGWLEFLPLLQKGSTEVIDGFTVAKDLLPFPLLGIDTDNGSEFINHDMIQYCADNSITFTRSRAYRKNDQAFVEEKNGSVVRRLIGYDRFEGQEAWRTLMALYRVLRLYVNFFQPSLKLLSKKRYGARVTKKYDEAKTPFQRVLVSDLTEHVKDRLTQQYQILDSIALLSEIETLQNQLWKLAADRSVRGTHGRVTHRHAQAHEDMSVTVDNPIRAPEHSSADPSADLPKRKRFYKRQEKVDGRKAPRTWKTRQDPFAEVWDDVQLKLELDPHQSAASLLTDLMVKYPGKFRPGHRRTLQRRVKVWRSKGRGIEGQLKKGMLKEVEIHCENNALWE